MSVRLEPGTPAPAFTLADASVKEHSLSDYAGSKVILYFYPKASTPGCTKEACDFRDSLASLQGAGYSVIGVSADSMAALERFTEKQSLTFPLASHPHPPLPPRLRLRHPPLLRLRPHQSITARRLFRPPSS